MKNWKSFINETWKQKINKKWDKLYWAIDLHNTVITGVYNKFNIGCELYPYAKEVLDYIYLHNTHTSILWTSSYDDAVDDVLRNFNLKFNYMHSNPECKSTELCNFDNKFYFNFLLDDKALFDPMKDWKIIYNALKKLDQPPKKKKLLVEQYEFKF